MSTSAEVASLDAVRDWKAALGAFRGTAQEALVGVELAVRRACDWLDERRHFWQHELRRREEAVTVAKSELWRRKNMPIVAHPDCTEQEKALRRALHRLEEAHEKLEKNRQWGIALRRAIEEYEGPARRLGHRLEADVPKALALLGDKIAALEAYVATAVPVIETGGPAGEGP